MTTWRLIRAAGPLPTIVSETGEERAPLNFRDRARAYQRALEALETDVQAVADGVEGDADGAFAWAMTPDWIRRDDLKGLLHWYYLTEIVAAVHERAPIGRLSVDAPVPAFVTARLGQRGIEVPESAGMRIARAWARMGALLRAAGMLIRVVAARPSARRHNARIVEGRSRSSTPLLLIQMPPGHMRHRYGPLPEALAGHYRVLPFGLDVTPKRRAADERYDRRAHVSPGDLPAAALRAWALRRRLRRLKSPRPLPAALSAPGFFDLILAMVDDRAIERVIDECAPKSVILFWPVTRPQVRMVIEACRARRVPVVLIPGRTLSRMKAAERLIPADRRACRLDDPNLRVVVADPHSRDVFLTGGFAEKQLMVGSTHAPGPAAAADTPVESAITPILLVLLQADRSENRAILESLQAAVPGRGAYRVRLRAHPKMALSETEKAITAEIDPDWEDVTGRPYPSTVTTGKTLAVTVFSTSGIDVAVHGAGLLWIPWITDQAVTMADMMEAVGEMTADRGELAKRLAELQDGMRLEAFCDRCRSEATAFETAIDVCAAFAAIERDLA